MSDSSASEPDDSEARRMVVPASLVPLSEAILGAVEPPLEETDFLLAIEATLASLAVGERRGFRALLVFVDCSRFLRLRWGRVSKLPISERTAHLEWMQRSPFGLLRRAVGLLRTLVVFSYYGQPPTWDSVRYGGPWIGRRDVERLADPDLFSGDRS